MLPSNHNHTGVPVVGTGPPRRSSSAKHNLHGNASHHRNGSSLLSSSTILLVLATAIPSFFLGTLTCLFAGIDCQHQSSATVNLLEAWRSADRESTSCTASSIERQLQARIQTLQAQWEADLESKIQQRTRQMVKPDGSDTSTSGYHRDWLFPSDRTGRFVTALVRTPKLGLVDDLDLGVPVDPPGKGYEDVLLLYSRESTLPQPVRDDPTLTFMANTTAALEHCDFVNVVLTEHSAGRKQCIAVVPQYESYHLQKWMRAHPQSGKLDTAVPLRLVSRGHADNGRQNFIPPALEDARQAWEVLKQYLDSVDAVLEELKPLLENIAIENTVIVMVVNFGQTELLMNFVCAAKSRSLDLSNVIVFTTDQESTDLATSLGLTAYYDQRNFGEIPSEAARRYGDRRFTAMMMAKVICVQLVSMLGYDLLFQDVDIVWFSNPLEYFAHADPGMDMFFQDDGAHSTRYAPYSANSGLYFVRHNRRTRHFLTSLLMVGDLIVKTDSHQQALVATLNEHVSLFGLRVKVLARETDEFPGGYHWNQRSGKYMRAFYSGDVHPVLFHMSWTLDKLLYLRQMGEWYVQEHCVEKKRSQILGLPTDTDANAVDSSTLDLVEPCCSAEALVSCHYRDKPSIIPCKDSPPIDKGKPSFW